MTGSPSSEAAAQPDPAERALLIDTVSTLDDARRGQVRALAAVVEDEDGAPPLSDQALTLLGSDAVTHLLALDGDQVAGYAQLDLDALEVVAAVDAIGPLLDTFSGRQLSVWSHGARSRLDSPLGERGYERTRVLHQLRRALGPDPDGTIPTRIVPDGVQVRGFRVGEDEDEWVRVNAAAFAAHPEQGSWTRADVEAREAESWFDPDGLLLALRGDALVGFHWTKRHSPEWGEVYVIGVDPGEQGTGLGGALLTLGLDHLRDAGCSGVLLYVDDDNTGAMRLYERYGFTRYDADVQWHSPHPAARSGE